jgi:opacity protein-like surface antigen
VSGHRRRSTWGVICLSVCLWVSAPRQVDAQIRGFADVGGTIFAARESFAAILGSNGGPVFGGGVEAALPHRLFVSVRASRFRKSGHRVFLFEGQQFDLDIKTTVTVTPLEFAGGYRFRAINGVTPYGGGGIGWHHYGETSAGASGNEDVSERFVGYHGFGGLEFRLARQVATAVEGEWATVPNALGRDPNGVSAAFDEHDLGGLTVRLKVVVGR